MSNWLVKVAVTIALFFFASLQWSLTAAANDLSRRTFMQLLGGFTATQAFPELSKTAKADGITDPLSLYKAELVEALKGAGYPRNVFYGQAIRRLGGKMGAAYLNEYYYEYTKITPAEPVMDEALIMIDEILGLAKDAADIMGLPFEQTHEEIMHAIFPELDIVRPGINYSGKITRTRKYAPLPRERKNQILRLIRKRLEFGDMAAYTNINMRLHDSYQLPTWAQATYEDEFVREVLELDLPHVTQSTSKENSSIDGGGEGGLDAEGLTQARRRILAALRSRTSPDCSLLLTEDRPRALPDSTANENRELLIPSDH